MKKLAQCIGLAGLLFFLKAPAMAAPTCSEMQVGKAVTTLEVARPANEPMCAALTRVPGTLTIVTIRPVERATATDVLVATSASREAGDLSDGSLELPDFLGGVRILGVIDDSLEAVVHVRPRHGNSYKLALMAHEVNVGDYVGRSLSESMLAFAAWIAFDEFGGRVLKEAFPILDGPAVRLAIKAAKAWARSESDAQLVEELIAGALVDQGLRQSKAPALVQIMASVFIINALRELSRGAVMAYSWTLPPEIVDTSPIVKMKHI